MKKALGWIVASAVVASASAFAAGGGSVPAKAPAAAANRAKAPAAVPAARKPAAAPAAKARAAKAPAFALKSNKDKVSYLIGYSIGMRLKQDTSGPGEIDVDLLAKGLSSAMAGGKLAMSEQEAQQVMQGFQQAAQARQQAAQAQYQAEAKVLADKNQKAGDAYLEANRKKQGVVVTASGLQYQVLKAGEGDSPKDTDTVKVHYRGTLIDGSVFDSSYDRGEPVTFPVTGVIPGWTEALQLMKPGAKWQVAIPGKLAYGEEGRAPRIGPNATLLFDVELLAIEKPEAPAPPEAPAQPEAPAPAQPQAPAQPAK